MKVRSYELGVIKTLKVNYLFITPNYFLFKLIKLSLRFSKKNLQKITKTASANL